MELKSIKVNGGRKRIDGEFQFLKKDKTRNVRIMNADIDKYMFVSDDGQAIIFDNHEIVNLMRTFLDIVNRDKIPM